MLCRADAVGLFLLNVGGGSFSWSCRDGNAGGGGGTLKMGRGRGSGGWMFDLEDAMGGVGLRGPMPFSSGEMDARRILLAGSLLGLPVANRT